MPENDSTVTSNPAKSLVVVVVVLCALAVTATAARTYKKYQTPGRFDVQNQGFCDFHNGTYYPSLAFLAQDSPYGMQYYDEYPVAKPIPFFSPLVLAAHAPFAALPLRTSEVLFFVFMLLCVAVIGLQSVRASSAKLDNAAIKQIWFPALCVVTAVLYSRSGHGTIFTGYWTFELIIGVLLALHYGKSRPMLAAIGLTITSFKPTFAIPLALVMLSRGHLRSVVIGTALSAILAGLCFGWLAIETPPATILDDIREAQNFHRDDPREMPVNTWTRLDTVAIVAKWTNWNPNEIVQLALMLVVLAIPCALIAYLTRKSNVANGEPSSDSRIDIDGAGGVIGMLCALAFLVSLYHHFYDALVLVAPLTALVMCQLPSWKKLGNVHRLVLFVLTIAPLFNYASAAMIIDRLHLEGTALQLVTSLNGISLTLALAYLCVIAWIHRESLTGAAD